MECVLALCDGSEVPRTSVIHVCRALHGAVVERKGVEEVHFVETPLILEPCFHHAHIDAVVVTEASSVIGDHIVVSFADLVLTNIDDIRLGKAAVSSQLLDITVRKSVDIDPLLTAEEVVNRFIVDTLRELTLSAEGHLEVVNRGIDIVERRGSLLNVVMAALEDISRSPGGVIEVIGKVRRIDIIPVDLCGLVITVLPEIDEGVILVFIDRGTYEVVVVPNESGSERLTVHILADEQAPRVVCTGIVIQLLCRALVIGVSNLAVPVEGRQVTIVIRTGIGCIVEVQRRVGIPGVMVAGSYFEFLLLIDGIFVCGNDGRVIRLDDTRVAYVSVLITPIGVIVIGAGEVINLLRYRRVLSTLGRSTEGDQFETGIVPYALCGEEIAERVVLDTFSDDTFIVDIR